jgi:S1-C subfamily serine protease
MGPPASLQAQDHDDDDGPHVFTLASRPRIGVMVESRANAETDRYGARLADVTGEGPADKAGLKAGDIITRFNGVSLAGLKADDDDESGPGARLVELARKLDAGDTVQVEYRRDGQSQKTTLIASDLSSMTMRQFRMKVPDLSGERPKSFMFEDGPGDVRVFMNRHAMGLNLTDLTPELGEYFGVKSGALVLESPGDSTLPLRAGDVILSIDARAIGDASDAHRILGSYAAGETAKLEVQRKQRKVSLTWKAPEARERQWRVPAPKSRVRIERS